MLEVDERVYIEYCIDCHMHQWSTKHDEEKYYRYYKACKDEIISQYNSIAVYANQIPPGLKDLYGKKNSFPRIGAFEVYYRGIVVFSKLQCGLWPHPKIVAKKITDIKENRRKLTKKESNKSLKNRRRHTKSTGGTRTKIRENSNFPNSPKVPVINKSYRDMDIQTDDINLPHWKESYLKLNATEGKAEENLPEKDSFFMTEFKPRTSESPTVQKTAESLSSPVMQDSRSPVMQDSKSMEIQNSKSMEMYEDHKEGKDEESGGYDSQYEEDYEEEEEENEEITKLQKELEEELQRYEDSFENEEEDQEHEQEQEQEPDYESEFDEEAPEREVTKTYEINLPINKTSSKKIPYLNKSDQDCEFTLLSSDPTGMNTKEATVLIPAQEKGKFQLKFAPQDTPCERRYLLYVDRNGEEWECMELIARYS
jgi:hypothetical protein